jgi:hypothetical protein
MATRPRKSGKRAATPRKRATTPRKRAVAGAPRPARAVKARRADIPVGRARLRGEGRPPSAHDELVATMANLHSTSEKLLGIDPASLSDADFERWATAVNQVDLAIARTRNSLLSGIADAFEGELPAIQKSTGRLKTDLQNVNQAVAIINLVSGALGVIEQIIRLGL